MTVDLNSRVVELKGNFEGFFQTTTEPKGAEY